MSASSDICRAAINNFPDLSATFKIEINLILAVHTDGHQCFISDQLQLTINLYNNNFWYSIETLLNSYKTIILLTFSWKAHASQKASNLEDYDQSSDIKRSVWNSSSSNIPDHTP